MNVSDSSRREVVQQVPSMRKLVERLPVGIWCSDLQGRCVYVNRYWCELAGRSEEEMLGKSWEAAVHPEDKVPIRKAWEECSAAGERFCSEHRYLRPDGSVVWVHAEVTDEFDEDGNLAGYLCCVSDTTELHHARAELQAAHEQLEERVRERTQQWREVAMIVEQTDDAIIWSDLAGRIVGWNQAAEKLFGYSRSEVLGGSTMALTPQEEQGALLDMERRVRLGEAIHHREVCRLRKNGERVPVLLSLFPLRGESGVIVGSACILRNLTEQKKTERGLRALTQRLLKAQDEERRRIARELHDSTAQVLVALSIDLGRLCMEYEQLDPQQRAQLLAESCLLSERATAEIRTQSYLLHPPMLEERGLVAALRFYIDGFTERSGIEVDFQAPKHLLRLDPADELTLFRIVQESLGNVHRHSESTRAEITLTRENGFVELMVRDFGRGLPADRTELRGVGVAGMRERVAQLGGTFQLESAAPGTRVRVRLPVTPL